MKISQIKTILIDGYLDEPSCLGVPPYISPHIRYAYGALLDAGIREENLTYYTIDQLRANWDRELSIIEGADLVIIIAGTTVPGHYLGGKPISLKEIKELGKRLYYPQKVLGGPITLIKRNIDGYDHICNEIAALDLYQLLTEKSIPENQLSKYIENWSTKGAELTKRHPNYPYLVCEIETFRGCPRNKHCAFCSERLKNKTYQRSPEEITAEVKSLAEAGNHYYRIGCQTDLLLYQARQNGGGKFILNPAAIEELYLGIREADPELKVLHLDNINPANITRHPAESKRIIETIGRFNTPGDVAAFGLESADPLVLKQNNIEASPDITYRAVEIINEIGGIRQSGIPKLLPGINLLHGLIGEREETMEYNYDFLKKIYDNGLMLRRINIRKVVTMGNYPRIKIDQGKFIDYKNRVNEEINHPMLKRVFPVGTVIKNVLTEEIKGNLTYGRQLGSYPILVGIPGRFEINKFIDVRVIDHGYRSITALPWPFKINEASPEQLASIPGIGKKRANKIFVNQPSNLSELQNILGNDFPLNRWRDWFNF